MAEETRPDAVLMDVVLKGAMDGIETADPAARGPRRAGRVSPAHGDSTTVTRAADDRDPTAISSSRVRPTELLAAVEVALYKREDGTQARGKRGRFRSVVESAPYATV